MWSGNETTLHCGLAVAMDSAKAMLLKLLAGLQQIRK